MFLSLAITVGGDARFLWRTMGITFTRITGPRPVLSQRAAVHRGPANPPRAEQAMRTTDGGFNPAVGSQVRKQPSYNKAAAYNKAAKVAAADKAVQKTAPTEATGWQWKGETVDASTVARLEAIDHAIDEQEAMVSRHLTAPLNAARKEMCDLVAMKWQGCKKRIHDERTNSTADDTSTASRNAKHLSDHSDTLDLFIKQGADGEIIFIKFCCEKCSCKNLTWPLDPDEGEAGLRCLSTW